MRNLAHGWRRKWPVRFVAATGLGSLLSVGLLLGSVPAFAATPSVKVTLKPAQQVVRINGVSVFRYHSAQFGAFAAVAKRLGRFRCASGQIDWPRAQLFGQATSLGGPACPAGRSSVALTRAIFAKRGTRLRTDRGTIVVGRPYRRLSTRLRRRAWVDERVLDDGGATVYGLQQLSDPCAPRRTLRRGSGADGGTASLLLKVVVAADGRVLNAALSMPISEGTACE